VRFITIRPTSPSRNLKLVWIAVFSLGLGFGIYGATFFNFITEFIKIQPRQLGWLEATRELPGFLCFVVAALTMRIAEPLLSTFAFLLMALGLALMSTVHAVPALMLCSFVWSVGLHTWMPLQSSITMHLAEAHEKGKRLGQTAGSWSLGAVTGMAAVLIVGLHLSYQSWFLMGGGFYAVAAYLMSRVRRDIGHVDKPRFVLKSRYRLYYALTFLEGCRKQVFFTFAVFALTKVYHTPLRIIALLMLVNGLVNMFGAPVVGRLIDRIGERKILLTSYAALIFVFIGYAEIRHAHVLYVMYCLDNLFYLSTACLTTYLQKIAAPEDLMPTLSMGVTMNHIAAVLVPLIGGYLWASLGYPVTFKGGAIVVFLSLLLASRVGRKRSP